MKIVDGYSRDGKARLYVAFLVGNLLKGTVVGVKKVVS